MGFRLMVVDRQVGTCKRLVADLTLYGPCGIFFSRRRLLATSATSGCALNAIAHYPTRENRGPVPLMNAGRQRQRARQGITEFAINLSGRCTGLAVIAQRCKTPLTSVFEMGIGNFGPE